MAEADHLRIVFRLGRLGVVMPVASLLAIREPDDGGLPEMPGPSSDGMPAKLAFRGIEIPVYDLARHLCLDAGSHAPEQRLLVFVGAEQPWALMADKVEGVLDRADFCYQGLPDYLFAERPAPYLSVALKDGEPLVSFDALALEQLLAGGEERCV